MGGIVYTVIMYTSEWYEGGCAQQSLSLPPLIGLIQEFDYFASHDLDCAEDTENASVNLQNHSYKHARCFMFNFIMSLP